MKKLKSKIRPRPKEPQTRREFKGAGPVQGGGREDIVADNKKLNEDIASNEFAMERPKAS